MSITRIKAASNTDFAPWLVPRARPTTQAKAQSPKTFLVIIKLNTQVKTDSRNEIKKNIVFTLIIQAKHGQNKHT